MNSEEQAETPETFLKALGKGLTEKDDFDAELAHILTSHILTATPAKDALTQAKNAILKLADHRAKLPEAGND